MGYKVNIKLSPDSSLEDLNTLLSSQFSREIRYTMPEEEVETVAPCPTTLLANVGKALPSTHRQREREKWWSEQ
jgi:hypothetical protein